MNNSQKYHHLIPKTYLSAWANSSGTLKIEYKNDMGNLVERNKEKIGGISDFHSIKAGMPICTAEDAKQIFSSLANFSVVCDGFPLKTPIELNNHYADFSKWRITRSDGSLVSNKKVKDTIEKVKIRDIEENWSIKYENRWNNVLSKINNRVLSAEGKFISAFEREFLIMFYTTMDWRGFKSNIQFEYIMDHVKNILTDEAIPASERILPSLNTSSDEFRYYVLLNCYRDFFNEQGVIYKDAMASLKYTNFHFLINDSHTMFLTSDSPVFIYTRYDGYKMGILPITPRIIMAKGRCIKKEDFDRFYFTHITDEDVKNFNDAIIENATEFIIHPN